ncbi:Rieske 2Fe-2S domain-containing protein [Sphaerisporangium sp. NPDC051011]|uniref:aromatic ring-hydroxylating oxygenase subunit alpha n=1 Tax=Sphaerisporangium sp. NPDC051011 TaxID=3155792 RepID=UPI0033E62F96
MSVTTPEIQSQLDSLVSLETGEIDRRIFSDEQIFDLEMKYIFGRAWLFLCHESQIPKRGDFFEAPMGRDNVLVVRQRDGDIKVLLNTCTHRGNAVCRAEEGNVKNFMCTYHGWTFGLDGELIGVPGMSTFYANGLDKSKHPLRQPAQVAGYRGFVFATFDPDAPPLEEFLGPTGILSLDLIAEKGDMEVVPGIQKFVLRCNWKFTVDNVFDFYHPQITHMSAIAVGAIPVTSNVIDDGGAKNEEGQDLGVAQLSTDMQAITMLGEYGHAISGPSQLAVEAQIPQEYRSVFDWRHTPETQAKLGPNGSLVGGHPHIFPTTWLTVDSQLSLRIPRSPGVTEVWWFSFRDKNASPEEKAAQLSRQIHAFGPAGMLEQEDGENWSQSTMQTRGDQSRRVPQALKMGIRRGKIRHEDGLNIIESPVNEYAQLWTYYAWKEWLKNPSWDELRTRTVPGDLL